MTRRLSPGRGCCADCECKKCKEGDAPSEFLVVLAGFQSGFAGCGSACNAINGEYVLEYDPEHDLADEHNCIWHYTDPESGACEVREVLLRITCSFSESLNRWIHVLVISVTLGNGWGKFVTFLPGPPGYKVDCTNFDEEEFTLDAVFGGSACSAFSITTATVTALDDES